MRSIGIYILNFIFKYINYFMYALGVVVFCIMLIIYKKKILCILKKIKKSFKKLLDGIHEIKIKNIIIILIFVLFAFIISNLEIISNFSLSTSNETFDYFGLYSIIISLILPLVILIVEKFKAKNYIITQTYLKEIKIFPIVIFLTISSVILIFSTSDCFFIFCCILSLILIIHMYYKGLKLLTDSSFSQKKQSEIRRNLVKLYLEQHTKKFDDSNKVNLYEKYGLYTNYWNYINVEKYNIINIKPNFSDRLISEFNTKKIKKIISILERVNSEYIQNNNLELQGEDNLTQKKEGELSLIVYIKNIGYKLDEDQSVFDIYYKDGFENDVDRLKKLLKDDLYSYDFIDNFDYVKSNYELLQRNIVDSINDNSPILFQDNLNELYLLYRDYIRSISEIIGPLELKVVANVRNDFVRHNAFMILDDIVHDFITYYKLNIKLKNDDLLIVLIRENAKLIYYSLNKKELLSIYYLVPLFNNFIYDTDDKEQLEKITDRILLNYLEIMSSLKYNIVRKKEDEQFNLETLIILNKNYGQMCFNLFMKSEYDILKQYLDKIKEFLRNMKENSIYTDNAFFINPISIENKLSIEFEVNIFATIAYIYNYLMDKDDETIDSDYFINFYKDYSSTDLSYILTICFQKDYNDRNYSWDMYDFQYIKGDGVRNMNTRDFLVRLYCDILNKRNTINIPTNYLLSTYSIQINKYLIEKHRIVFEKMIKEVENEEKKIIRNCEISQAKVLNFKNNFNEHYLKENKLLEMFIKENSIKKVTKAKNGLNYIGISNIIDKTYFLEKIPNNRAIIWSGFEDNFAKVFTESEMNNYIRILSKKLKVLNDDFKDYLWNNSQSLKDNIVIFANVHNYYDYFTYEEIVFEAKGDYRKRYNYASDFVLINDVVFPVVFMNLDNNYDMYYCNLNGLGTLEKLENNFYEIDIIDYVKDSSALEKAVNDKINGIDLTGEDKRKYLLEKVNIIIRDYIYIDDKKIKGYCFKIKKADVK